MLERGGERRAEERDAHSLNAGVGIDLDRHELAERAAKCRSVGERLVGWELNDVRFDPGNLHGNVPERSGRERMILRAFFAAPRNDIPQALRPDANLKLRSAASIFSGYAFVKALSMTILQREAIDAIRELAGDTPDLLNQIVQMYLETAPALIVKLRAALAASDLTGVRSAAHSLKSSSANLGAVQLAQLCSKLEAAARAGSLAGDLPDATQVEKAYEQARAALIEETGATS